MDPSVFFGKISYGTEINRGQERRNFAASLSPGENTKKDFYLDITFTVSYKRLTPYPVAPWMQ